VNRSYDVNDFVFGVRSNSARAGRWLDECLDGYRISEQAEPYYSILLAEGASPGPVKRFHVLYRESTALTNTLDLSALANTFLLDLEFFLFPEREDALFVEAAFLSVGGRLVLMPSVIPSYLATLGRGLLKRARVLLPMATRVAIDPSSGKLVPIRPRLDIPDGAAERFAVPSPASGRDDRILVQAPSHVELVVRLGTADEELTPISRANTAQWLASHTINLPAVGGRALEGIGRLVESARCYELRSGGPRDILDSLSAVLADG
jgi:hypothetical protein